MKKTALFSLLIACSLGIVGVPEASTPLSVERPSAKEPFTAVESLPAVEPLTAETTFPLDFDLGMFPTIPHCGDWCDNPGQSRGCIDSSGRNWVKTFCTCSGGSWTC